MSTLGGDLYTLYDWAKELAPDGKSLQRMAMLLSQKNQFLDVLPFVQGNLPTGHQATVQTGLSTPTWRMLNSGVPNSTDSTAQVNFQCGMLSDRSQVDRKIAKLNRNEKQYRYRRMEAHMEGMTQEMAQTSIYGTASSSAEFVGLASYYNDSSAENGEQILLAGGSGSDTTSIYLVGLSDTTIYGIFPSNSQAGLMHEDLGLQDAFDENGNRYRAYMDNYEWDAGLVVEDWRYGARIANIEVSDLVALTSTQALTASTSIIKLMTKLIDRIYSLDSCKPYFLVNRTVASNLRIAALDSSNTVVTVQEATNQFGKRYEQLRFHGIPLLINDCITNAETAIS